MCLPRDAFPGEARRVEVSQPEHARLGRGVVRAHHTADVRGHRGEVDDAAPVARAHAGQDGLGHQEARLQVDCDQLVPILLGDLFDALHAGDAGVIHQDFDVAELRLDGIHQAIDAGADRDVGLDGDTAAPEAGDLRFRVLRVGGASPVIDRQVGACPGKCYRDGTADAPAGTGDQGDFALQIVHPSRVPCLWWDMLQLAWPMRGLCGAGTPAGRVPTLRDAWRARSKVRPEESGRGRLRVCATVPYLTAWSGAIGSEVSGRAFLYASKSCMRSANRMVDKRRYPPAVKCTRSPCARPANCQSRIVPTPPMRWRVSQ